VSVSQAPHRNASNPKSESRHEYLVDPKTQLSRAILEVRAAVKISSLIKEFSQLWEKSANLTGAVFLVKFRKINVGW